MHVLLIRKTEEDPIKTEGTIVSTTFYSGAQGQVSQKSMWRKSNSSEILWLSWLPASCEMFVTQGQITPNEWSDSTQNWIWPSFYACPGYQQLWWWFDQKWTRHHFLIFSLWEIFQDAQGQLTVVSGPIWPKFELAQDFMHVLVTCKYKKDRIKSNREKVETPFSPL